MNTLNRDHVETVIRFVNKAPYFGHLGIRVVEMGIGYSTVTSTVQQFHLNPFGRVHAGLIASAIDIAAYWSVYCECPEESGLMTIDLKIDYLKLLFSGKLIVRGKRTKIGRSICLAEAIAVDENDSWIAHGTSKMLARSDLTYPKQIIRNLTGETIPSKFI
jgi:uncharacterized protein (TIGR00369 family)